MTAPKPWYKSKTIWAMILAEAFAILELKMGLLQPLLPADTFAVLSIAVPILAMVLRAVSTQGITLK